MTFVTCQSQVHVSTMSSGREFAPQATLPGSLAARQYWRTS